MALVDDTQQYGKDFARRRHGTQYQGIKVRQSIKDKRLSNGTARRELHNFGKDFGIVPDIGPTGKQFRRAERNEQGRATHEQVGPKHEIIWFGLDAHGGHVGLEAFLVARRDAIQGQGQEDIKDARRTGFGRGRLFLAHACLLYTSPSPRDGATSRMPSSA